MRCGMRAGVGGTEDIRYSDGVDMIEEGAD